MLTFTPMLRTTCNRFKKDHLKVYNDHMYLYIFFVSISQFKESLKYSFSMTRCFIGFVTWQIMDRSSYCISYGLKKNRERREYEIARGEKKCTQNTKKKEYNSHWMI